MLNFVSIFLPFISIILSRPTPFLPPLLLPSSSSSQADLFKVSNLPLLSSPVLSPPSTHSSPPPAPQSSPVTDNTHGPCRYCNLCQCKPPSAAESQAVYSWIQKQFYNNEGTEDGTKDGTEEETEEGEVRKTGQVIREDMERHMDNAMADREQNEIRRRRDRLL